MNPEPTPPAPDPRMDLGEAWVLVPVYNERPAIGATIEELRETFAHVLVVDDGSTDGSGERAREAGAAVIRHVVNQGQGAALQTGFDYLRTRTGATHAITFDADGQHRVDDAVRMLETAHSTGVDVVLASRFAGESVNMSRTRRWILRAGTAFTRHTSGLEITDTHNGLRVLSRRALDRITLEFPRMAYASELLDAILPAGLTYTEVPTTVTYTEYSRSKGQRNSNAINILFDLALRRIRSVR